MMKLYLAIGLHLALGQASPWPDIAGYTPGSDVTKHANLDLDQQATAPTASRSTNSRGVRTSQGSPAAYASRSVSLRKLARTTSSGLPYYEPLAPRIACPPSILAEESAAARGEGREPRVRPLPTLQRREHLAHLLEHEGLRTGAEVGVQAGTFAAGMLRTWRSCTSYLLIDLWAHQPNYRDGANLDDGKQHLYMQQALSAARRQARPGIVHVCRNYSTSCAEGLADRSLDFVYVDARHDYKGVLADVLAYWPKLRVGGIMAGHDYIYAAEHPGYASGTSNYSINFDGTVDPLGRAAKGAVDDFFTQCVPRQVVATYREPHVYASWMVRK